MNVLGKKVTHDEYGEGTIECIWNDEISIRFNSLTTKKFNMSDDWDHLTFETPELAKQVLTESIDRLKKDLHCLSSPADGKKYLVRARTHAAFINAVFQQNLKRWFKCTWNYNDSILVWMVRFHNEKDGWQNRFLDSQTILQHYNGYDERGFYHPDKYSRTLRLVVSVDDGDYTDRLYRIEGLFRLARERCTPQDVYFERVDDKIAHIMMPSLF